MGSSITTGCRYSLLLIGLDFFAGKPLNSRCLRIILHFRCGTPLRAVWIITARRTVSYLCLGAWMIDRFLIRPRLACVLIIRTNNKLWWGFRFTVHSCMSDQVVSIHLSSPGSLRKYITSSSYGRQIFGLVNTVPMRVLGSQANINPTFCSQEDHM